MEEGEGAADGRRARAGESRRRIVLAMLGLMRERGEVPLVDEVAERASVSRRSVFRLYADRQTLLDAAIAEQTEDILTRFPPPAPFEGSAQALAEVYVGHLARVYEHIAPIRGIAERVKAASPEIREAQARSRAAERTRLGEFFSAFLPQKGSSRGSLLDALQTSSSWQAWSFLRSDLGLSARKAEKRMAFMLASFLFGFSSLLKR